MKFIKSLAIIGGAFVVIGIIGFLFTYESVNASLNEEIELSNADFDEINLEVANAEVEFIVTNDEKSKATLTGKISGNLDYTWDAEVINGILNVNQKGKLAKLIHFDFLTSSLKLTVYVPEKTYELLKVNVHDGKVILHNMDVGESTISIKNGKLDIHNMKSKVLSAKVSDGKLNITNTETGNVDIQMNNGSVSLDQLNAEEINANIHDGKIAMENVTGEVNGKVRNGAIALQTEDMERNMDLEVNDGTIKINSNKKPENVTFDVSVEDGIVHLFDKYKNGTVVGDGEFLVRLKVKNGMIQAK